MEKMKGAKNKAKNRTCMIILAFAFIVAFLLLSCVLYLKNNESGTLVIRGKVVNDISIELDTTTGNMLVPLVSVLQELDYNIISQQNECIILSSKEGWQFELNLEDLTLYKIGGNNMNCLTSPPGSHGPVCVRKGNDIILDVVTFNGTLFLMDNSGYKMILIPKYKLVILY